MNLEEIAEKGNKLNTLKALRCKIANAIDESSSGRDIAALSLRLMDVMDQINSLEGNDDDELDVIAANHRNVR